nr:MAG TPA: hypothetical protein [Caudoviricetes sp.]
MALHPTICGIKGGANGKNRGKSAFFSALWEGRICSKLC